MAELKPLLLEHKAALLDCLGFGLATIANASGANAEYPPEVVCMLPGDNENDPWEILRYHQLMQHVDILIPFAFNKEVRSLYRNGLSYIYRFIINTTFFVNFNYTNGTVMYTPRPGF